MFLKSVWKWIWIHPGSGKYSTLHQGSWESVIQVELGTLCQGKVSYLPGDLCSSAAVQWWQQEVIKLSCVSVFTEIVCLQALGQLCVELAELSCDLFFGRGEQPFPVTECQLADRHHARLSWPLRERAPRRWSLSKHSPPTGLYFCTVLVG